MTETASLFSLFVSSFLAATLLPGGSEAVLFGVLKAYPATLWLALGVATVGNTLGGLVSFGIGRLVPQTRELKICREGAALWRTGITACVRALDRRCALPGRGLVAVFSPWQAAVFIAIGKFARYTVIAYAIYPVG